MKKITLLTAVLCSFIGFSQANKKTIQNYLETHRAQWGLSTQDISDLSIINEFQGKGTQITSCYVVQRYNGIDVFNGQSTIAIKNGEVIKVGSNFQPNMAQKVNATSPSLSVIEALNKAYTALGYSLPNFSILESPDGKKFTISDGTHEDPIVAKLAYLPTSDSKLKLAWGYQFYAPDGKYYWDIKIDALNGNVLEQKDLTISCAFGKKHESHDYCGEKEGTKSKFDFSDVLFGGKSTSLSALENPGTYRVIPYNYVSPNHSPFELVNPYANLTASPRGWHNANTLTGTTAGLIFTYTRGNNIWAQEDANGDNGTGLRPDGGASLIFDFPYVNGVSQTQQPTAYTSASTTNLFYMTNIMHDVWYNYGFDEANGNYQQQNYGRGGAVTTTGDVVQADSQDGYSQTTPTNNNANFTPTNDGVRPRIQMFMWTEGAPPTNFIQINSPSSIAGPMSATTNVFEGTDRIPVPVAPNGITADLVHYTNDPNPNTNPISIHNACIPASNVFDLSGKIALIRRGNCNFSNKVKNAQDAGALAAVVYDTVVNNPVRLQMSSTGLLGITIPAIFISKEKADLLLAEMATGTVNIKIEVPSDLYLYADGSFDNGIISHEYGHGISNRLVGGGLSGCMGNYEQMGEGWSDWFSLMMQIKAGDSGADPKPIGTYAINQPNDGGGLRGTLPYGADYPYSTDMSINPLTFANSNIPIPTDPADTYYRYNVGDVWASVLWDLTWAYIGQYGFDPDIYNGTGGNNKVMQLVLDALKLETCGQTSIITGRNNLFAADQAITGGANYNLIAEVFRRRGMGLNASSGSANDCNDQVEDFTSLATVGFDQPAAVRVFPNPTSGTVNVHVNQYAGKVSIQIVDLNGRSVYNQTDDKFNNEKSINISSLQKGVYIMKVTGDRLNYTEKIIKN
ncbi:T9SS type A sorting domain-containing protein [Flavobacterium sp. CYK-4]|uniref:T9SS-dependent M36 family metallopeptidase n=1 Tax=Flavobacterium lotistagni TaxID=2709660 RepID=UPI00140AF61B|nr:T9SS-dependent M36 family metallopeptidase [Flavobacterium lotistagni]NHM05931.1 T9SS type A sorting domain-containing protein [Flavobacterium lotistagni]